MKHTERVDFVGEPRRTGSRILIVGLTPHDAGKTTVARALTSELVSRGYRVGVSKPIAGHNLWYQRGSVRNSMELGILVGEDAVELKRSSGSEDPVEAINPVDIALAPLDPEPFLKNLRGYHEALSSLTLSTVMMRITTCMDRKIYTTHYIVGRRVGRTPAAVRAVIEAIASRISPKPIDINPELVEQLAIAGYMGAEACYRAIAGKHQILVIESFNDAASPLIDPGDIDTVLAVTPGKILLYSGAQYLNTLRVVTSVEGSIYRRWWPSTSEILKYIKPLDIMDIPYIEYIDKFGEFSEKLTDRVIRKIEAIS
jgi:predicted P-loop ATPase/GTPase